MPPRTVAGRLLRVLGALGSALILFCSTDRNPFSDGTHARAHVIGRTFGLAGEGDSIRIFSTETLTVVVAVREYVDSFKVVVPGNRLGTGDTLTVRRAASAPLAPQPYPIVFSFRDTGEKTISIHTYRPNREMVSDRFSIRVWSPLDQQSISGVLGTRIRLATPEVGDPDVWYHWSFGQQVVISSARHEFDTVLNRADPLGQGWLWVSDIRNRDRSPLVSFRYSLQDNLPPVITPLHPVVRPAATGDTIVTGDSSFTLRLRILDPGTGVVRSATLNGQALVSEGNSIYSMAFRGLHVTAQEIPLSLDIEATDFSGNTTRRTLRLRYDPLQPVSGTVLLTVVSPSADTTVTARRQFETIGMVQDQSPVPAPVSVRLLVNNRALPDTQVIYGQGVWGWTVPVDSPVTVLEVVAGNAQGGQSQSVRRVLIFDPAGVDSLSPVIAEVFMLPSGGVQTENDTARLRIIAFDEGTGIESLTVNNRRVLPDTADYLWYSSVALAHTVTGNAVVVRAVDRLGRDTVEYITLYRNRSPRVLRAFNPPVPLWAGTTYVDSLEIYDPDGDRVTAVGRGLPPGCSFLGGTLSWTPQEKNAGWDTIIIDFSDGFPNSQSYWCPVLVALPVNQPCSLSFTASRGLIAGDTLVLADSVGLDVLRFTIHDRDPVSIENYSVWIEMNGTAEVRTEDSTRSFQVVIDPSKVKSGGGSLRVIVEDKAGNRDTVALRIVLPAPTGSGYLLKRLRINTTTANGGAGVSGTIVRFPLLVRMDSTNFDFRLLPGSGGLLIRRAGGTEMPYDVDAWDPARRYAALWVLADTIYGNDSTQYLELCWDQHRSGNTPKPRQVFDTANGYRMVYHLDSSATGRGAPGVYRNSAQDVFHGTDNVSASPVTGVIGRATGFNGYGDYIALGTPDITGTELMISCWVRPNAANYDQPIVHKADQTLEDPMRWSLRLEDGSPSAPRFYLKTSSPYSADISGLLSVTIGAWSFIAASYDGSAMRVYSYGSTRSGPVGSIQRTGAIEPAPAMRAFIGAYSGGGVYNSFSGIIDEVRIESRARSEAWIRLCYETQKPDSRVVRVENAPNTVR